jgi:UDP-glucose 4-epimerase
MKVLVIGASGFIGTAVTKRLNELGIEWRGLDAVTHEHKVKQLVVSHENIDLLVKHINQFEYVINASGSLKPTDFSTDFQSAMDASWSYLDALSKALRRSKVKKYLHISSAGTVYGEVKCEAFTELSETSPTSWYGRAKLMEEMILHKTSQEVNFDFICVRLSNPYGNNKKTSHGLVDVLINSVLNNKKFVAKFSSDTFRDFIHIDDAARKIVNIFLSPESGVFNVGNGKSEKLLDIVQFVHKLKPDSDIVFEYDEKGMGVKNSSISMDKYNRVFGAETNQSVYKYIESRIN